MSYLETENLVARVFAPPLNGEQARAEGNARRAARMTAQGVILGENLRPELTLEKVEKILGPARSWVGAKTNCVKQTSQLLEAGFCPQELEPRLQWGLFLGAVAEDSQWRGVMEPEGDGWNSAWIETNSGLVIHLFRWIFENAPEPYLYIGEGVGEYS